MNDPSRLIDAYLDDSLDEAEAGELQRWLAAERGNLRDFMRATAVHRELRREFLGAAARSGFAAATDAARARPQASSRRLALRRRRRSSWLPRLGLAAAACLLIALGALLLAPREGGGAQVQMTAGTVTTERGGSMVVLRQGEHVRAADVLQVGEAPATLRFSDSSTVTLDAGAELVVTTTGNSEGSKQTPPDARAASGRGGEAADRASAGHRHSDGDGDGARHGLQPLICC